VQHINAPSAVFSRSYWARSIPDPYPSPASTSWLPINLNYDQSQYIGVDRHKYSISAPLAWLSGCIQVDIPDYLLVNCSSDEYEERLHKLWRVPDISFRYETLRGYGKMEIFENPTIQPHAAEGRLAVHTQHASLNLDWDYGDIRGCRLSDWQSAIGRTSDGKIAGSISLDEHAAEILRATSQQPVRFITLSITHQWGQLQ
jgi:hypothetical protein